MLFILRQIREAGGPGIDQATIVPQPAPPEDQEKDFAPDVRHMPFRTSVIRPEPGSLEAIVRRRVPEQFDVMFWLMVLAAGLAWNGAIMMSRWNSKLTTSIGSPAAQPLASNPWYNSLDRFNVLLWLELLFVAGVALVMYLRSRRSPRRFKVRPGQRLR